MAIKPGFITGANAKIKMFDETLAYCTDVGYNIDVQTIPIESMGKYEVHSNEPVSYSVSGTLSVIRYTNRAAGSNIDGANQSGNRPEEMGDASGSNAQAHLDPRKILSSETFDLEIFEKTGEGAADSQSVFKISDCRLTRRGATLNKRGVLVDQYAFVGILAGDTDSGEYDVSGSRMGGDGSIDLQ